MLKEVSGMEKKILLSSCETDYNSDLHSWIDIERQIKNLADAGFTHTPVSYTHLTLPTNSLV